ncbi:hypothetical protein [Streptomyces sp. IBSBF 2435]|uniref:hypothetical protein n=1 Tax=Streptomyces sp. IBSBF 2435 TaxID=2903531 RepID=UPI002FDC25C2
MSAQPRARLKSHAPAPDQANPAKPAPVTAASSAPKVVTRQGALSAVRPDPHLVTITGILPGLQVHLTGTPVADWLCRCGHHERATGRAAVIELTIRARVGTCPHTTTVTVPTAERRQAA